MAVWRSVMVYLPTTEEEQHFTSPFSSANRASTFLLFPVPLRTLPYRLGSGRASDQSTSSVVNQVVQSGSRLSLTQPYSLGPSSAGDSPLHSFLESCRECLRPGEH